MRAHTLKTVAASALACATLLTAAAAPAHGIDPESMKPGDALRPGTAVPYPAPPYHEWRHMRVVRSFDPRFYDAGVEGIRVRGIVHANEALCLIEVPNSIKQCHADGKESTSLGYSVGGDVVTFSPFVGFFAPLLQAYHMGGFLLDMTITTLRRGYF